MGFSGTGIANRTAHGHRGLLSKARRRLRENPSNPSGSVQRARTSAAYARRTALLLQRSNHSLIFLFEHHRSNRLPHDSSRFVHHSRFPLSNHPIRNGETLSTFITW